MNCWVKILSFEYVAVFIEYNKAEKVSKFTINFFLIAIVFLFHMQLLSQLCPPVPFFDYHR